MKVLYLVPQPKRADRLTAYSFVDEEIEALAAAGVQAYVLSTASTRRHRASARPRDFRNSENIDRVQDWCRGVSGAAFVRNTFRERPSASEALPDDPVGASGRRDRDGGADRSDPQSFWLAARVRRPARQGGHGRSARRYAARDGHPARPQHQVRPPERRLLRQHRSPAAG